ncbi:MAG: hypothetical protein ACQEP3_00535 [Patescibacteria group bacterium]
MTLEDSIKKIKTGKSEEVKEAKKHLKKEFNAENPEVSKRMINDLEDYYVIGKEKNKIAFIYGLRLAAREKGKEFFPLFTNFITKNIQSDSGNVRQAIIRLTDTLIESLLTDSEKLSEEEKNVFSEFIDEVLMLLENYYDPDYEKYSDVSEMPASKYKSLEMLLSKIINPGQESVSYNKQAGMPEWMDCTWKRVPCMKEDCPICSKLKDIEEENSLFQRGEFLIEVAGEKGTEENLPGPEEFPFYLEIKEWLEEIISIADKSKNSGDFWIFTEEAADLFWYMNVVSAKIYRQLCNRYLIENSEKDKAVDYKYTRYVLTEALKKIKKAIKEISKSNPTQIRELREAKEKIEDLEEKIFNI